MDREDWAPEFTPGTTDYYPDENMTDDREDDLFDLDADMEYDRQVGYQWPWGSR